MTRRPDLHLLAAAAALAAAVLLGGLGVARLAAAPPPEVELAGYATSLRGRTSGQRHNAVLAARALDGVRILAGGEFSYNRTVRSWTVDRGYVKAPVSYDGELVPAFGGGVCQTSTTLYNAALLAGFAILERHPHVFAPSYVTPGRDAAVAQYDIDLRMQNPYPWPVRIAARTVGDRLEVRLYGHRRPAEPVEIVTHVAAVRPPGRLMIAGETAGPGRWLRNPGAAGYRVLTYRVTPGEPSPRRELLSDDTYQSADRIVVVGRGQTPQTSP
ncbi:MAG: VanW family protein [Armatimonadota bacterium]|nr:VanW family protein [Armatimonadota bacterium]